jgi:signal transduction histidine kinase/putative methionine-R-sulfoxide reductase with GAF domain
MVGLSVLEGPGKGKTFELRDSVTSIGRTPDNDIQIKDNSISREHLRITRKGSRYFIEDLNSTNGTFVNDKRVPPGRKFEVKEGLPISIGRVLVSVGRVRTKDIGGDWADISSEVTGKAVFNRDRRSATATTKNLELIYKVANVLMQSLDINEVLEKILDYIFDQLKRTERGGILLVNSRTGDLEQIISRSRDRSEKTTFTYNRSIADWVIKESRPVAIPDMSKEDPSRYSDSLVGIKSVMCVPLISRAQVRGVIYVDSVKKPHGFRDEDLYLITALSSPAAVAIENALLYSNLEKTIEDRTESLRETEKRLRESETRFKAIFDNMTSGVIVYEAVSNGQDFVILDLNRAAQKIERINKSEAVGKGMLEVFPAIKDSGLLEILSSVWAKGKPERSTVTLSQDKEVDGWREYYVYRLPSGEIVSIYDDVTGKRKAEEEQKALQKQLFASQKMESIGAFAGGTAHNFRNILQAISGNIEYLEMIYGENGEIKEVAKSIYDSVEKGVDLINNLLHFSKRGEKYQLTDLDLADVIVETYKIINRVFNKNISIKLNLDENLFVEGDHSLLSQVFMNLLTNARDAMPDGGTLSIEAKRVKDKVVAVVSDTGEGMDKETMEKIFDPFFTLKDVGTGTGLGLSTTHGIVEQHKGSISVSSELGKGSTFKIGLPFVKTVNLKKYKPEKEMVFGKGQKVLIVDDELPTLEALANMTTQLGYKAISVDKSIEALDSYTKWEPDIVLMDRSMPEMDGVTCIKRILEIEPKAKIVIVSGYEESGPDGIDESIRGVIKGYLNKPCGMRELSQTLSRVLIE